MFLTSSVLRSNRRLRARVRPARGYFLRGKTIDRHGGKIWFENEAVRVRRSSLNCRNIEKKIRALFLVLTAIMGQGKQKTKYSDQELGQFKLLIEEKIRNARTELNELAETLSQSGSNGDDAAIAGKTLEDGSATLEKEQTNQLAARQKKFIEQLEAALVRIRNKTYGICRSTGKLIPAERLRAVPHTTQSMEAKMRQGSS